MILLSIKYDIIGIYDIVVLILLSKYYIVGIYDIAIY
jgi:hypothetical protein